MKKTKPIFTGIYAASLTPMHPDFSCNLEELVNHCNDLLQQGCNGIVLFGTTGEGPSFSVQERIDTINTVIQQGLDPQRLIITISANAIEDAVALCRCAIDSNCSAVMILPPFYFKNVSDDGVISYYREVIRRVSDNRLKVILYHIPQLSGVPITLNIIARLREEFPQTVIGIKESEGNLALIEEILSKYPDFKVFAGKETELVEAMARGAVGGISGLANAFPKLICSLYEHSQDTAKPNNTAQVKTISDALKKYPIFPAIKSLVAAKKGKQWTTMRPPLMPLLDKLDLLDELD